MIFPSMLSCQQLIGSDMQTTLYIIHLEFHPIISLKSV